MDANTRKLDQATDREVHLSGRSYLFFGGTAYFGLIKHPDFITQFQEGLLRYGVNNGTSRHNNVQLGVYDAAEQHAAAKFGFENAIIISSGYLASQLAVRELSNEKAWPISPQTRRPQIPEIIYSPSSHPSLWLDKAPQTEEHVFEEWVENTVQHINESKNKSFLIISNTFDNVIPKRFDFTPFNQIEPTKNVHLILDDSHGLGVFHPSESAVKDFCGQRPPHIQLTVVASMAKGLGLDAGVILGDWKTIERMRQTGIFIGGSPPAPAFAHTFLLSDELYRQQWEKLSENIRFFEQRLPGNREDWTYIDNFPVFYKAGAPLAEHLRSEGILISSFPYPDPTNPPIDRIVLSAAHRQEDLDALLAALVKAQQS